MDRRTLTLEPAAILRTAARDKDLGFHVTASWADVQRKAKRIRAEGGVTIVVASNDGIGGQVKGDKHTYEAILVFRPGTHKVADWTCGCAWAAYAFDRSPAFKRFEGRKCSHALALQFEAQSQGMFGKEVHESEPPRKTRTVVKYDPDTGSSVYARPYEGSLAQLVVAQLRADGEDPAEIIGGLMRAGLKHTAARDLWKAAAKQGTYFHNTFRELEPGDELKPASELGLHDRWHDDPHYSPHHVYMWHSDAHQHPEMHDDFREAFGDHTYEVQPEGRVEADPERESARDWERSQGTSDDEPLMSDYTYRAPRARVVRKVESLSAQAHSEEEMRCPHCGGYIGPAAIEHGRCPHCGHPLSGGHHHHEHEGREAKLASSYWHGTDHDLDGESHLLPPSRSGQIPNHHDDEADRDRVFMTDSPEEAAQWGRHVYEVHPRYEPDEDDDHVYSTDGPVQIVRKHSSYGQPNGHGLYLRFGHWPKDERSHNNVTGGKEDGVSVYDLDRHGEPMDPDPDMNRGHEHDEHCEPHCDLDSWNDDYGNDTLEEMRGRVGRAERNRRSGHDIPAETGHLVKGEMVGIGHDGEPLLRNVKRVGDWIDHRHHFLPGAEPHPLADEENRHEGARQTGLDLVDAGELGPVLAAHEGFYHVAPTSRREQIAEHGIDYTRGSSEYEGQGLPPGNYVFDNRAHARWYREHRPEPSDIWHVRGGGFEQDPLHDPETGAGSSSFRTMQPITPDRITLHSKKQAPELDARVAAQHQPLYRGLYLGWGDQKSIEEFHKDPEKAAGARASVRNLTGLGIHWTPDFEVAKSFAMLPASAYNGDHDSHDHGVVLEARVHPDHIVKRLSEEGHALSESHGGIFLPDHREKEVTVRPGAPVDLTHLHAFSVREDHTDPQYSVHWAGGSHYTAARAPEGPQVSGVALKAHDTGRVLMLQRGLEDEKDPAAGTWEFPGGHHEDGDLTSLHAGIREWQEEVGHPFPDNGIVKHTWTSPDGVYQGHVVVIPSEKDLSMRDGRVVPNPDDPHGDHHEQAAWWEIEHAKKNPALREEMKTGTPWKEIQKASLDVGKKEARNGPSLGSAVELASSLTYQGSSWDPISNTQVTQPGRNLSEPQHSTSKNPVSTGFATSEDPQNWDNLDPGPVSGGLTPSMSFDSTLHDGPEPALPSTDGTAEYHPEIGFEDLDPVPDDPAQPDPYQTTPGITLQDGGSATPNTYHSSLGERSVADIVADFQKSAAGQALMTPGKSEADDDIASAARAHLNKTALADFSPEEQRELINENPDARARNFADLKLDGSHYALLEEAMANGEVDPSGLFL